VGISTGSLAGAVLGTHRRFNCLYGDTVNAAARMCQRAVAGVHVTAAFAAVASGLPGIRCVSRGVTDVKGMGPMETFDLHLNEGLAALPYKMKLGDLNAASLHLDTDRGPKFVSQSFPGTESYPRHEVPAAAESQKEEDDETKSSLGPDGEFEEASMERR
jgi:hypothetical protein